MNHLNNVDPAMTDEQRLEVHDRYRKFAAEVNRRRQRGGEPCAVAATAFRFNLAEMDLFRGNGKVICTQVRRRARASIPYDVVELLDPQLSGQAFDAARLCEAVGDEHGQAVLQKLVQRGVLVAAPDG